MINVKIYPRSNKIFVDADPEDMTDNALFGVLDQDNVRWSEGMRCVSMPLDEFMNRLTDTVTEMLREGMTKTTTEVQDDDWDDW